MKLSLYKICICKDIQSVEVVKHYFLSYLLTY